MTHQRVVAYGSWISNGGFPAMNLKSSRSQPNPLPPVEPYGIQLESITLIRVGKFYMTISSNVLKPSFIRTRRKPF